ncbi:tRNA (guanosine(18)-2'-O)-methyltransferase [Calidithermus roseus]|uniref:tRNA (guanosine(18)-2'-O)-methyltransferase n=1 Tax=Calidithermus roseus TaxID=1644118 RepID=A0A399EH93_9DEIN|nr:tRNA (guanosine(18)-2'-O)-methyltransferase TrmH [Calidithermus roseus]RIH83977.1 tRNA (guanosine(18)-2'-O)-methyltransferase [Calidithermus roseus]
MLVTPEREHKLRTVLSRRQPDLTVLMEQVNKPHNLSAILRTCDAVGVLEVHAIPPQKGLPVLEEAEAGKIRTYNDTSGSAAKWVGLRVHPDVPSAFAYLKGQGFRIYATRLSEQATDYRAVDYTQPTCILLGAEKWGVSEEAAALADGHIVIPMLGMVQSLNVSVAAAVILFEAQRQRLEAGLYERPRLSPQQYQAVWEAWSDPRRR